MVDKRKRTIILVMGENGRQTYRQIEKSYRRPGVVSGEERNSSTRRSVKIATALAVVGAIVMVLPRLFVRLECYGLPTLCRYMVLH